jgi:hypothetical protein
MSFNDDFFEELLVLGGVLREIRFAMAENLPEETLLALENANATLSGRALQILDGLISDAQIARGVRPAVSGQTARETTISPVSSPLTTVPENTSSQPSPSDLAVKPEASTTGVQAP